MLSGYFLLGLLLAIDSIVGGALFYVKNEFFFWGGEDAKGIENWKDPIKIRDSGVN